ncbi:MAG TPA: protein-(glutamine-N5) methyltransferase, release factor-specific, partial [Geobacteraceae bacterium]
DGGADGLDYYRRIVAEAPAHLNPGGWLFVEVGIGQAQEVAELFRLAGFNDCRSASDPAGIERVVGGRA